MMMMDDDDEAHCAEQETIIESALGPTSTQVVPAHLRRGQGTPHSPRPPPPPP